MKNFLQQTLIVLTFILCTPMLWAQPGEAEIKEYKGKKCYVHAVERGQTLYSISKMYSADMKEIKSLNEGTETELSIGQIIYIPLTEESVRFVEHEVQRKETVYGISREYGITSNQLIEANPDIKDGLKKGTILQVPVHLSTLEKYKIKEEEKQPTETIQKEPRPQDTSKTIKTYDHPTIVDDSTFMHIVMPKETLYAISKRFMVDQKTIKKMNDDLPEGLKAGDTLYLPRTGIEDREILVKDPYKEIDMTDTLKKPSLNKKEEYNVVFLLPFYLDKNASAFTSPKGAESMYSRTKWAMEFYMGALVAIDSLKQTGTTYNITTLDTKGDTAVIKELLKKKKVQEADLIIGPFFGKEVEYVSSWAKFNQVPMMIPFSSENKILLDNPYVIKARPSKSAMIDATVQFVLENYRDAKLYLLKSNEKGDKYPYERFKSMFEEMKLNYKEAHEISMTEINLSSSNMYDINRVSSPGELNVFIVPSQELKVASNALTKINKVSNENHHRKSEFVVIGLDNWLKFKQIDFEYKNKLNLHVPSDTYLNYTSDAAIEIVKKFRSNYNYDPSEFAFQGFDLTFFALGGLHLAGKDFVYYNNNLDIPVVKNNFKFKQVSAGCGFENQHVYILRVKDYELVNALNHIPIYVEQEDD